MEHTPMQYPSKTAAEEVLGSLISEWRWEAAATNRGMRAFFNHGPQWLGLSGRMKVCIAIVPDNCPGRYWSGSSDPKVAA